jgi:hypothetical protein
MEAGCGGTLRNRERARNLGLGQTFELKENENRALVFVDRIEDPFPAHRRGRAGDREPERVRARTTLDVGAGSIESATS